MSIQQLGFFWSYNPICSNQCRGAQITSWVSSILALIKCWKKWEMLPTDYNFLSLVKFTMSCMYHCWNQPNLRRNRCLHQIRCSMLRCALPLPNLIRYLIHVWYDLEDTRGAVQGGLERTPNDNGHLGMGKCVVWIVDDLRTSRLQGDGSATTQWAIGLCECGPCCPRPVL